ncbi:threonine--tRNA ligase [Leuconostoc mesenteroides]|uniref:Threonine--tRNA ligase n=3 Tax=Leuconostoc mesenteroides TaxID=1245 RepID=SYT_LEUMM|nr:threonine--tRNA ligase [Leuconostoc mesenteroides]Q03YF0.1 RecName: Full=Threonine--tRNA ligase; AltName: Full=Threonyl-tRNA synthetase; Short=ThrRS [Leuconostoc mesenteroides subsp. mesenteroides ATCC 8293]ABJ61772.1 threonyl-tRNA synthetase / Ser-tRNA(Thr) hydrolase [Leuconostoc mesenteroides subsp. mesenteroides ATCC 8293]MCT3041870.1 threonine--tRNA ligase [Leuconostoc mesenteroides]MCU4665213.1 threonine--tRNA ligase [Leuconostoc mesenteroides]MDG9746013.1 threonine--tRNA ligase [Leuco
MAEISLTFPDGAIKKFDEGIKPIGVAESISKSLAKKSVSGKINGSYIGMNDVITESGDFQLITTSDSEALDLLRHSASHLLAQALKRIPKFANIHFGVGPFIENGFYYDTDNGAGNQVSIEDFPEIEAIMHKIVKEDLPILSREITRDEALEIFADDPYKVELVNDLPVDEKITIAVQGDHIELDKGGLVPSTGWIKHFKLTSVAGAYWRGDSSNPMMQRVYGTAFWKAADVEAEIARREEAKERDHRVIGRDLDLFFTSQEVGSGLPVWLPNGATIRRQVERYITDKELSNGYQHVYTPVLSNLNLYKTSGHWDHYREDMFPPMDMGDGEFLELRPMNCPSHIMVFNHKPRSYRELPMRIAELGMMHRYEKSGALTGLSRVREMTLNDGHTFVEPEKLEEEFKSILTMMMGVYRDFNIKDYRFRLSYRDPKNTEKYFDDDEMWEKSQKQLKTAMDDLGLDYFEAEGEAAFYGPKLDVQTKTALGNEETLSTIQLDFLLPERFDLKYIGRDGLDNHRPVMLHRGIVGTMERFTAYLIEMYKGAFPTWLSPLQVQIIPVNLGAHGNYANAVQQKLQDAGLRANVETKDAKMGYLIREAQTNKIPYTLVLGDSEVNSNTVTVRKYGDTKTVTMSYDEFQYLILSDVSNYSRETE